MSHYHRALQLARTSSYPIAGKGMAAVLHRGGALLNAETNRLGRQIGQGHAEHRAVRPHQDYRGATVVVARSNGGCSRPCAACLLVLRTAGVTNMVYADRNGNVVKERV